MNINKFKGLQNVVLPSRNVSDYGNVDGLSLQNLFYARNGYFPNCFLFDYESRTNGDFTFDTHKMSKHLIENIPEDENVEVSTYYTKILGSKDDRIEMGFCIILNKSKIYARFEKSVNDSYILYPNDKGDELEKFLDLVLPFYVAPNGEENTCWRICASQSGYYLEKANVKCPQDFDVSKLYNDSFIKEDEKIQKFIEENGKSGLVILHGAFGTGKSSYIKHLINKHPDKKFVFVPSMSIRNLGSEAFGSFLTTLNEHIIILEDCENAIRDRKGMGDASAVSLLLNMTDGILGDDLNMKFICTFNDDMKTIDSALLRKGRCISKYEFTELSKEKAQALLKERGIEALVDKPLTLADVFHYEDDDYQIKKKSII